MCGIIFGANIQKQEKEPVNQWITEQFEDQFSRGTQGFGLVFIKQNGEYKIERACEPYKALIDLKEKENQAPIILMHHRMPTSSQNKIQETHPFMIDNGSLKYKYLGAHNGIITNDDAIKEEHEKLGFIYTTERINNQDEKEFNDSECLIIEISRYIEKQIKEIGVQGGGSFIVLQIDRKTDKIKKVFFGRTSESYPLKLAKDANKIRISSEGEGHDVTTQSLYSFGLNDFKIEKIKLAKKEFPLPAESEECTHWADYHRRHGQNDFGFEETQTTPQTKLEEKIENIYEKAEDKNAEILLKLNLFEIEREVTEQIEDPEKVMQLDAKRISLEVARKVYETIKECQANFLEAMMKEEKICSMMPDEKKPSKEILESNEIIEQNDKAMDTIEY